MGTWKTYKLGDVCTLQRGHDLPHAAMRGGNIPVIGSQGIIGYHDCATSDAPCPGVTLGRSGSLGTPRYWTMPYWAHNTTLYVKDFKGNHPLFICYLLSQINYQAFNGGGAVPTLNRNVVHQLNVSLPPLEVQERIAGILGAYDDLIAVNERRMALLEEAAHRLWRDRFITRAAPAWPLRPLGEVAEFRKGKTITGAQARPGAIPVVAGGTGPAYYHDRANTKAPVLTVSASGTAGFARLYYEDVWASDCSYQDGAMGVPLFFVYCFLKANRGMVENLKRGAAQPHVYTSDLNALEGRFDMDAAQAFESAVSPYFEAIGVLSRENVLLREGRDKLLPRLLREEV